MKQSRRGRTGPARDGVPTLSEYRQSFRLERSIHEWRNGAQHEANPLARKHISGKYANARELELFVPA